MTSQGENRLTIAPTATGRAGSGRSEALLSLGGIVGAVAAASCCLVPLALFALGVSGAWVGNLTRLAPYQGYFIAATLACLGGGYWLVYRSSHRTCDAADLCGRKLPNQTVKVGLVLSTVLVAAALAVDFLAPLFY